jgi:acid phosphatase class B
MVLSLDFDETYTRDPLLWDNFIKMARHRGHKVYVVTMRYERESLQVTDALKDKVDGIFFTGRKAKYDFMIEQGIIVNVWVDDMPWFILTDAKK